jgi:hypothetical protein
MPRKEAEHVVGYDELHSFGILTTGADARRPHETRVESPDSSLVLRCSATFGSVEEVQVA